MQPRPRVLFVVDEPRIVVARPSAWRVVLRVLLAPVALACAAWDIARRGVGR